ncbi:hypothetical protein TTHERM_00691740 (macronuclear) [Tetrahymena thermophila SB210]|uniref:Uncharacterized protein n=1 Tax=Tetrahymena thermophila (strain SB210) TaxID=312017 RepID=I7LT64_TETTS|nr:hypothetical protein TTHERM_00691740 [Tetrahymena thermophila SB210]EAR84476.1 hypothetical protein TTHERM_00691740 [Tetrahymena thermophila SB210]|eukprot:XP_001032139.1 hypothetical protein TTHERM_00691740 [Tetrahymena thermophila SB210]
MGQLCFKHDSEHGNNNPNNQNSISKLNYSKQSISKSSNQSFTEDPNNQYISRDIKITLKQKLSEDHDTEDDDFQDSMKQNQNQNSMDDSQQTISHHRNKDQSIRDISPLNNKIDKEILDSSQAKIHSSKLTNTQQKNKKKSKGSYIFTGTLGHNSYLDMSSQSIRSNRAYTESEIMNKQRNPVVKRNFKK